MVNWKNAIISVVFILIGAFLIRYALIRPCTVAPITQTVMDQVIEVTQPPKINRLLCLSTDYIALISMLIGTALVFPGVGGLSKSLMSESSASTSKGKKPKKKK